MIFAFESAQGQSKSEPIPGSPALNRIMRGSVTSRTVEDALKAYLTNVGRPNPFVSVVRIATRKADPVYMITVQPGLAYVLQPFLEARMEQYCPYVLGSFLVDSKQAECFVDKK